MSRADIFIGMMSDILGGIVFAWLHDRWFYSWLYIFGENANMDPTYQGISQIFYAAPFLASGVIVGLVAGLGIRSFRTQFPARVLFGPVLSMTVLPVVQHDGVRYATIFLPALWISFTVALTISYLATRFPDYPPLDA